RYGPAWAGAAEVPQALARGAPGVQAPCLAPRTGRAPRRSGPRGRPRRDAPPAEVFSQVDGAWASSLAPRQGRIAPPRGVLRAPTALDETPRSPHAGWHGDNGQRQAARGGRFLHDPPWCAA